MTARDVHGKVEGIHFFFFFFTLSHLERLVLKTCAQATCGQEPPIFKIKKKTKQKKKKKNKSQRKREKRGRGGVALFLKQPKGGFVGARFLQLADGWDTRLFPHGSSSSLLLLSCPAPLRLRSEVSPPSLRLWVVTSRPPFKSPAHAGGEEGEEGKKKKKKKKGLSPLQGLSVTLPDSRLGQITSRAHIQSQPPCYWEVGGERRRRRRRRGKREKKKKLRGKFHASLILCALLNSSLTWRLCGEERGTEREKQTQTQTFNTQDCDVDTCDDGDRQVDVTSDHAQL